MDVQATYREILEVHETGDQQRAIEMADRALVRFPDAAPIRYKRALFLLSLGRWTEGWPDYELRTTIDMQLHLPIPRWNGCMFPGQSLLIIAEQGLGDTLHCARYTALVKQRGGRVHLACNPLLWSLLGRTSGVDWIGDQITLSDFNYSIPLMSLPALFGTTPDHVPGRVPYASASPDRLAFWRNFFASRPGFHVGFCATGSPKNELAPKRDIPIALFELLAMVPNVSLYGLNPQSSAPGWAINLGPQLRDFHETAAVVQNLDLVITCDTALAHLCGAVGAPTWLCIPFVPDWRWLLDRDDSPWYPSLRLFRQPNAGNWPAVFERVEAALRAVALQKK
jgi:hypothetical protein